MKKMVVPVTGNILLWKEEAGIIVCTPPALPSYTNLGRVGFHKGNFNIMNHSEMTLKGLSLIIELNHLH